MDGNVRSPSQGRSLFSRWGYEYMLYSLGSYPAMVISRGVRDGGGERSISNEPTNELPLVFSKGLFLLFRSLETLMVVLIIIIGVFCTHFSHAMSIVSICQYMMVSKTCGCHMSCASSGFCNIPLAISVAIAIRIVVGRHRFLTGSFHFRAP